MSETIDYRLLNAGEPHHVGDERLFINGEWVRIPDDWAGEPVSGIGVYRRRTTLRDELAELEAATNLDVRGYKQELRALIRKHYPNAEQGSATSAEPRFKRPLPGGEVMKLPNGYQLAGNYGDGLWRITADGASQRYLGTPKPTEHEAIKEAWRLHAIRTTQPDPTP